MSTFFKTYSLNHCRHVMHKTADQLRKTGQIASQSVQNQLRTLLLQLEEAILQKDRTKATALTKEIEGLSKAHLKKSWFAWGLELIGALIFALVVATVIRQVWFEPYEIPTGSMRPTFKEQDTLTVSKAQFGINVPLQTAHFYFDPDLIQRTSTIIFSADGLPLRDVDTTFLGIFPYKKRYVKRLIGKPKDSFYFYGGKLYARDAEGKPLDVFLESPWMKKLEHIPFISFDGQPKAAGRQEIVLNYFNMPLARVKVDPAGSFQGQVYNGSEWVADHLIAAQKPHESIETLSDLFGMKNYAMAQLYTAEELAKDNLKADSEGILYLVLRHTPHLDFKVGAAQTPRIPKMLTTVMPLKKENLETLMGNLYTARFVVKDGKVKRYSHEPLAFSAHPPRMSGVPDGTYEFYYGKAYSIGIGGLTSELEKNHPLYQVSPKHVQTLFNLGIQWDNAFQPLSQYRGLPNRYAYFRNGDFYLLGAPFLKKDDTRLGAFIEAEKKQQSDSSPKDPYIAFTDHGIPDFNQKAFALKVPEKKYLVLGDNHAMSADSRVFGFVPEDNLQGVPEIIFWPIGERMGHPAQKPYPTFVWPRMIVWAIAALVGLVSYAIYCYRLRKPLQL